MRWHAEASGRTIARRPCWEKIQMLSWFRALLGRCTLKTGHFTERRLCVERLEARSMLAPVLADFNNDGYSDLAIGSKEGAVNVIYGSATGLNATSTPDQLWHQDSPSIINK